MLKGSRGSGDRDVVVGWDAQHVVVLGTSYLVLGTYLVPSTWYLVSDLVPGLTPDLVPDLAPDLVPDLVPDLESDLVPDLDSHLH